MSVEYYDNLEGLRVSQIAKYAVGHIDKILTPTKEDSESIVMGNIIHSFLLRNDRNGIPENIMPIPYPDYKTSLARKLKDEALEDNKIPVLECKLEKIIDMIINTPKLSQYFPSEAVFEKALQMEDIRFGLVKGRVDCIHNNEVWDLKVTTQTNNLDKKIFDMGYQVQMYLYMQLANLNSANLLFFNPETQTIHIKEMIISEISIECEALLDRALKMKEKVENFIAKKDIGGTKTKYNTPQWAYAELISEE